MTQFKINISQGANKGFKILTVESIRYPRSSDQYKTLIVKQDSSVSFGNYKIPTKNYFTIFLHCK